MAEKRYYWLKFKDDFFDSKRIKKLRKLAGGDTYVIIYLKMQLKALRTDGVLEYTGVEANFADELALDIDENSDDVRVVLAFLLEYKLCECSDNIHYFLPYVIENTGSETATTQRVRDYRERQKALHCNASETQVKRIGNAEKENRDREKSKNNNSADKPHFVPPNIQDVRAYCKERGNKVDPENFWDFYQAKNWMIGKNKMKDWKAAVRTWERSESSKARKNNTLLNYREQGVSHANLNEIEMDLEEL